jgi:hypothetical protein
MRPICGVLEINGYDNFSIANSQLSFHSQHLNLEIHNLMRPLDGNSLFEGDRFH